MRVSRAEEARKILDKVNGGKPWKYLLIPHDVTDAAVNLAGLVARWAWN
jgi:hypothetical protein